MDNFYSLVKDFHKIFGLNIGQSPQLPNSEERNLRVRLLKEEVEEYLNGEHNNDLENIAKELADIIYIVCGTAVSYGIPLDQVFNEVHRSNLSKLDDNGNPIRREDGKVLKGPNYSEANIKKILFGI